MSNELKRGYFISLEGVDGCGKSTQSKLLADYLQSLGKQVLLTREPGGTPLAEEIRRVILTPSQEELDPLTEILLYAASRAQHVQNKIKPALAAGAIVICERFLDSSLAYQGYGLGRDLNLIKKINSIATEQLQPDLTFLLDLPVKTSDLRIEQRNHFRGAVKDRIEQRGALFLEKVRQGYLEIAKEEPRIVTISCFGGIQEVQRQIAQTIKARFGF